MTEVLDSINGTERMMHHGNRKKFTLIYIKESNRTLRKRSISAGVSSQKCYSKKKEIMANLLNQREKGFQEGKITAARLIELLGTCLRGHSGQKWSLNALVEQVASANKGVITKEIIDAESGLRAGQLLFEQTGTLFKVINKDLMGVFYDQNDQDEYGNHLIPYVRDSEEHVLFD